MKFSIILAITVAFAAVLLVPVDDAFADHDQYMNIIEPNGISNVCGPNNPDCRSFPISSGEQIVFELHTIGVYNPLDIIRVWIDKNNINSSTEIFAEFGNEGGTSSSITVTKNGEGNYQIIIDTTNLSDGTHNVAIDAIQNRNGSNRTYGGGDGYSFTIGALTQDVLKPVITIPELTTDQWGNENLELSMSGTTNFPTGSWTVTATDNVGVIDSACWAPAGGMDDPGDPWDSNTQSYDFSKITNPPSGQKFAIGSTSISCAAYDAAGNYGWANFNVVVTHDDPTGFVQYIDKPNSFGNTADSTTKIFYSANSAQGLHLLKPIADLLTESNTQGMLARDAEWTLLNGELEFNDFPNSFYTLMKKCYPSGGGQGCSEYQIPKPIATMLTDANMAGMWERTDPDRTWNVGDVTVTISDPDVSNWSPGSFNTEIQMCSTSPGGGTSCQVGSVLKPFSHLITESTLNQAMYERSNMKILDAGGPAASAPQSSAESTPYMIVPDDITITTSDIFEITALDTNNYFYTQNQALGTLRGAIAMSQLGPSFHHVESPSSYVGDGCWGNFWPQGWANGPVTFPIGTTTVTCGAVYGGVEHIDTFTVTVIDSSADTTPPSQSYTVLVNEMRGSIAANDPGGCASFNPQTCYMPSDITINVGDSVTWVNNDPTNNWYTLMGSWGGLASSSGDNACDGPGKLSSDMCGVSGNDRTSWTHTFDTVGTFNYHDWVYQNSAQRPEGVVNVVASGASTPVAVSVLVAAAQAAEAVAAAQAAAELAAAAAVDQVTIGALEESGSSQSCVETGCYTPVNATSVVGGVVTMTNTDPTGVHTFTSGTVDGFAPSPDGTFDTGVLMSGDSFEWSPEAAGEQPYYCMLHTWMVGTIIVQTVEEAAAAEAAAEAAAAQAAAQAAAELAAAAAAQAAEAVNATTTTPSATTTTPSATTTTPSATPSATPSTPTDNSITVKTNRETFTQGNPIVVFGKVSQTVNDDVVSLKISKDGNVIHSQDFKPTTKGDFTKLVTTKGNMWNDSGNYRIEVSYDGALSLTNFFLTSNPSISTNSTATTSTNSTATTSTNSTSTTTPTNNQNIPTTETQTDSQSELKISLNKQNFKIGESITIRASLDSVVSEQNVAVSVIDPNNKNVVSRTITIENSDQSNLQFKLVDNSVSGTYLVKITSLINGQTISDSIEFTVVSSNSGVEIVSIEPTDQQGSPVTEFTKNKMGFVKVVLSAENPINSLVTVNLFDSEFTSLGVGSFKTQLSGEHEIILSFFTPEFATIGNGEIYANVFSEWPSAGGIPLTGESSSQVILK